MERLLVPRTSHACEERDPSVVTLLRDDHEYYIYFYDFLTEDARHDLWVHSRGDNATIVWDRHDLIYAYGPLDRFEGVLEKWGLERGTPQVPFPHSPCFHPEYDEKEKELARYFKWIKSPLHPEDEE